MCAAAAQAVTIAFLSLALSACVGEADSGNPAADAGHNGGNDGGGAGVDAATDKNDASPPPAFPDETVTGWTPPGGHTILVGSQTIATNGTVLEDVEIGGCLTISATDVTVRRALIRCQGTGITVSEGASAVIEDVTIDGEGAGAKGVYFRGTGSMSRLDVHGYKAGIEILLTENVSLVDSYVHASVPCLAGDDDGNTFYQLAVRFSDGITVTHNNFDRGGADGCEGTINQRAHATYLVQMDVSTLENNLVNGGNGACVWIQNNCTELAVDGNHFGSDPHETCGEYGAAYSTSGLEEGDLGNDGCTWTNNVWDESGEPVPTP